MKIGILSFPNSPSYGATLQLYALFTAVKKINDDVEVINYINPYMKAKEHVNKNKGNKSIKSFLANVYAYPMTGAFRRFEKSLNLYPKQLISDTEELKHIGSRYDLMICGSDQVWNPNITGNDLNYFFDFCTEKKKKAAYAPSFGIESIENAELADKISELLKDFNFLSVREEQGKKIIKKLTDLEAQVVLDPTFLLTKDEWSNMAKRPLFQKKNYILLFTLNNSQRIRSFTDGLSKKTGCKVVTINGRFVEMLKNPGSVARNIGPRSWISLFLNSRYVVTDSFHGLAFAINFNKDFFVEVPKRASSRLENMLESFNLCDRVVAEERNKIVDSPIDYDRVNLIIDQKRKNSADYLERIIQLTNE